VRLLVALTSFAAVIGLAAPAYADDDGSNIDADFLAAPRYAGISYQDPAAAIAAGKTVCELEDKGSSEDEILGNLQQRDGFTGNGAAEFTVIAVGAYCPKYMTGEARGPKPEGAVGD
jgi:hypothetical protein